MTLNLMSQIATTISKINSLIETLPPEEPYTLALRSAVKDVYEGRGAYALAHLMMLDKYPVSIYDFMEGEKFLNMSGQIYPKVHDYLREINNPDGDFLCGKYNEIVFTGSIGSAKTSMALWTTAYQLYILSCYKDPHSVFGLDSSAEILFVFQSLSGGAAKNVDYNRFRALMENSHYFTHDFPFRKDIETELRFPNRIYVRPVGGDIGGTIGQNVFGGLIDEINFMEIIEDSKRNVDGGVYDQATVLYESIARRRKSRFMQQGRLPGLLCLVSSKNYPGQFTDRKEEEAKTNPTIYIYDKKTWDIMPEGTFTGKWFKIFIGDESRQPRILEDDEEVATDDIDLLMDIPVEYREEFEHDIMGSLRDIAGVSTLARYPYFQDAQKITECMHLPRSIFNREEADMVHQKAKIFPQRFFKPSVPRFAHIDLGLTGDAAGLAIGCVDKFVRVRRGEDAEEIMPHIYIDGILRITPPRGGEINFSKIRSVLYLLNELGLNIRWVSLDSWQSVDTIQILQSKGYMAGTVSLDKSTLGYSLTKTAIYDKRVSMPLHRKCRLELAQLEIDPKKNKIDHPATGSKDCSDALAGVIMGLTLRREIWVQHGIPINPYLYQKVQESDRKIQTREELA